jgi:hypothetical protein
LAPYSDVDDYEARLPIFRLDKTIGEHMRTLEKELRWLDTPTRRVLENARGDLTHAAEQIFYPCVHVTGDLGFERDLPKGRALKQVK